MRRFVFLVVFCAASCDSHEDNVGVKGKKSYGGYIPNNDQHNHNFQAGPQYHQPNYYQPYGWNFNQPTRTYGK